MCPRWRMGRDFLLLTLSAGLYTIASPPYEWAGVGWFALAPFFLVLREKTPVMAFGAGLLYGVLFCTGLVYWVYPTVAAYFPITAPIALVLTFLSSSFFIGVYTGLAALFASILMRGDKPWVCRLVVPAVWVCGEFARSTFFSGFSWGLLGYTQYGQLALIQISDIAGVYGVSFLLAFSSYITAEVIEALRLPYFTRRGSTPSPFPWQGLASLTIGIVGVFSYGELRLSAAPVPPKMSSLPSLRVALIRGGVSGEQRWRRVHYARTLLQYATVSQRAVGGEPLDLLVWPEFGVGFYPDREPPLRAQLSQLVQRLDSPLLFGAPRSEEINGETHFYNSAYLLAANGALLDVYDKIRLLPFAEAWPALLPTLLHHAPESPTDFTAGARSTVFPLPKSAFGVLICYEATYPALARRSVRGGADFLVNISNESWLGGKAASAQHLSMTIFRAVENRRYVARAATGGLSGFIDPFGRVNQLSEEKEGGLVGEVYPRHELTIYTRYGDWFVYACMGLVLFAGLRARFPTTVFAAPSTEDGVPTVSRARTRFPCRVRNQR